MFIALDLSLGPVHEIVVLGDTATGETAAALADLRGRFLPNKVVACRADAEAENGSGELDPIFTGRQKTGEPTVYVCENFTCQAPVAGQGAAVAKWQELETTAD